MTIWYSANPTAFPNLPLRSSGKNTHRIRWWESFGTKRIQPNILMIYIDIFISHILVGHDYGDFYLHNTISHIMKKCLRKIRWSKLCWSYLFSLRLLLISIQLHLQVTQRRLEMARQKHPKGFNWRYEGQSKFVVEQKCVTKLVSPLLFYMVSCFYIIYIFLPMPKHSFEASLLGSTSPPIFVCMHWETLLVFVVSHVVPPLRCSGSLSNQQVFWKENCFLACFGHSQLLIRMYPASAHNFSPSLRHTTNILFVTSWSAGALLEKIEYRLGIVLGIVLRGLHLCQSYMCVRLDE